MGTVHVTGGITQSLKCTGAMLCSTRSDRDIKPGNFLFNFATRQFFLIDFGLADAVRARADCAAGERVLCLDQHTHTFTCVCSRVQPPPRGGTAPRLAGPPRAGTRGFRAPEVLLRSWHQTPSLLESSLPGGGRRGGEDLWCKLVTGRDCTRSCPCRACRCGVSPPPPPSHYFLDLQSWTCGARASSC